MLAKGLLVCKLFPAQAVLLPSSDFSCFLFLAFFPLPPSLGCLLASQTTALRTAAWSSTSPLWEDKYFGRLERCKLSRKPAGRLLSSRSVRRRAGLSYSHFSCEHCFLPLTLGKQTAALRAVACGKRGLRCLHINCPTAGNTDIVQGGKSPGRLVEPGFRRRNEITHS